MEIKDINKDGFRTYMDSGYTINLMIYAFEKKYKLEKMEKMGRSNKFDFSAFQQF